MKKTSVKKNLVLTLVMALLFTAVPWPASMVTIGAAEPESVSGSSTSSNTVTIVEDSEDRYDNMKEYDGTEMARPTAANFAVYKVVSGNTTDAVGAEEYTLTYKWYDPANEGAPQPRESAPTDAGSYLLEIIVETNGKYVMESPYMKEVTISPKEITATLEGSATREYDGTTNVSKESFSVKLSGAVDGDDVSGVIEEVSYASANAAKQVQVKAVVALAGDDAHNYSLKQENITSDCGVIIQAKSVISSEAKAKLQNLKATCGQKLSDIDLSGVGKNFVWAYPETVVETGGATEFEITYTENGDKVNYAPATMKAKVAVSCEKTKVGKVKATKKKAGTIAHYKCEGCGKKYDKEGNVLTDEEIILPYFTTTLNVNVKQEKVFKLGDYMKNATNTYVKVTVPKKYKNLIKVDKNGNVRVKAKIYKNLPKNGEAYVTLKYKGGSQKIKIKIVAPKTTFNVTKKSTVYRGQPSYFFTIDYKAKKADKVKIEVVSGIKKSTKVSMNKWFAANMTASKDKKVISVGKKLVTGKVKFKITAYYGKMEVTKTVVVK